ncbi:MAG: cation:proton antiporter [Bacteroidales bacterium]|nr:cation:proton antiporter [Bacteroidales bacterium]
MKPIQFPLEEPIMVFATILILVLVIPVLLRKTPIPSIVGLILAGIVVGPSAFNIISKNEIVTLFSTVGLLYIMFLAGLEIEFKELKSNRFQTITFGILNFLIPFTAGYFAGVHWLNLEFIPALLIGLMLASNTLIAFPLVGKLNIGKTRAVNTAVSGTVIADTIVLIILAFITASLSRSNGKGNLWAIGGAFSLFTLFILFMLPRISKWFFKTLANDGNLQFIFALTMLFLSSIFAEMAGAEPIVGAFFAGLVLNKLIPSTSNLMNRIDFVGNTLFIPVFLISVGMLVNIRDIFSSFAPLLLSLLFIGLALSGKWVSAWLTKLLFRLTKHEMNVIFGLTTARAAATLAIALIGLNNGLISNPMFNAIILLILASSIFSSYITERYGKQLAIDQTLYQKKQPRLMTNRILIPIANPKSTHHLIDLAGLIKDPDSPEPIFPLAITTDNKEAENQVAANKRTMEELTKHYSANHTLIHGITRIDINVSLAIARTSKEMEITDIILGRSDKPTNELKKLYGNLLENILNTTTSCVLVCDFHTPISLTKNILVVVTANDHLEYGYPHWKAIIGRLTLQLSANLTFVISKTTFSTLKNALTSDFKSQSCQFVIYNHWNEMESVLANYKEAMVVIINARHGTLSYNQRLYGFTYEMPAFLEVHNTINLYPPSSGQML